MPHSVATSFCNCWLQASAIVSISASVMAVDWLISVIPMMTSARVDCRRVSWTAVSRVRPLLGGHNGRSEGSLAAIGTLGGRLVMNSFNGDCSALCGSLGPIGTEGRGQGRPEAARRGGVHDLRVRPYRAQR